MRRIGIGLGIVAAVIVALLIIGNPRMHCATAACVCHYSPHDGGQLCDGMGEVELRPGP